MAENSLSLHPCRYPMHKDQTKGQIYGGECNVTACTTHGAVWWNRITYGLYCERDAKEINYHPSEPDLCVFVEEKPSLQRMDEMVKEYNVEVSNAR